jgi:hypothetical protein
VIKERALWLWQKMGGVRERWGPVLVEKRLSRRNQDRRSVLEKAQDRKKLVNLEGGKGNSKSYHSSNVLSNDEISNIAREVGVCLDKNQVETNNAVREIQSSDSSRAVLYADNCEICVGSKVEQIRGSGGVCPWRKWRMLPLVLLMISFAILGWRIVMKTKLSEPKLCIGEETNIRNQNEGYSMEYQGA